MNKKQQVIKEEELEDGGGACLNNNNNNYGMPAPTNENLKSRLSQIDEMKLFFPTATQEWDNSNKSLKRFNLPGGGGESVSCVLWNDLFFITGTDIVRSLTFRFHAFGRPVINNKKFEEGIFSDLRNLKPGHDARLEEPKSELLDMLYKNNCIRTQKKQKVFFWFSVPHDRLFLDALERDLKREKMGMEPTTSAVAEPASSLSLDSTQELFDQLRKSMSQSAAHTAQQIEQNLNPPIPNGASMSLGHVDIHHHHREETDWTPNHTPWSASQSRLERAATTNKRSRVNSVPASIGQKQQFQLKHHRMSHQSYFSNSNNDSLYDEYNVDPISNGVDQLEITSSTSNSSITTNSSSGRVLPSKSLDSNTIKKTKTIFGSLSLFDGSPTYKQRRRRATSISMNHSHSTPFSSTTNPSTHHHQTQRRSHDKCHLRTQPPTVTMNSSRLAMAAVKAGFLPQPMITNTDYLCPINHCARLFKRQDHLERHINQVHTFICTLCGKQFQKSENLTQHHRLQHEQQTHMQPPLYRHDDNNDDHHQHHQQFIFHQNNPTMYQQQHPHQQSSSPTRYSFDSSRSSGWVHQQQQQQSVGTSSGSNGSRCSTLSPMFHDFEMSDVVMTSNNSNSSNSSSMLPPYYHEDVNSANSSPMTLLSPFKPMQQQQQYTDFMMDYHQYDNMVFGA